MLVLLYAIDAVLHAYEEIGGGGIASVAVLHWLFVAVRSTV